MTRLLSSKIVVSKIWPCSVSSLTTVSLGKNPRKGGKPPKEKNPRNSMIFFPGSMEITDSCLR